MKKQNKALKRANEAVKRHINLRVEDVCLLNYENKVKLHYCYCRISEVFPDRGVMRTVKVELRPRDRHDNNLPYKYKAPVTLEVAVQRLVLIVAAEDTGEVATNMVSEVGANMDSGVSTNIVSEDGTNLVSKVSTNIDSEGDSDAVCNSKVDSGGDSDTVDDSKVDSGGNTHAVGGTHI